MIDKYIALFLIISEDKVQSLDYLVSILRSTPNNTPLKHKCLIKKSNRVRPTCLNDYPFQMRPHSRLAELRVMQTSMELYNARFPAWQLNKYHIGSAPKTHTIASPGSYLSLDSNSRKKNNKDLWTRKDAKKKAPLLTGDSTSIILRTHPPPEKRF